MARLTKAEEDKAAAKLIKAVNKHPRTGIETSDLQEWVPSLSKRQIVRLLKASENVTEVGATAGSGKRVNPAHAWKPVQHGLKKPW